jgi:DNA invertase Pin-like site-specific DNA recombinase
MDKTFLARIGSRPARARPYVRISELSKAEKAAAKRGEHRYVSDAAQLDAARRAATLLGWEFDEAVAASPEYADLDESAFRRSYRKRKGIMRHLEDARAGAFEKLVVLTVSRFGRNLRESLELLSEFEAAGVSVYFAHENLDSSNESHRFVLNILLAVAQKQSEDTAMFIRSAWRQRAERNLPHGGRLPVWLERVNAGTEDRPRNEIRVVEEQADHVRRLVELRSQGIGYQKIARTMNAEGRRTSEGGYWTGAMSHKYTQETWIDTMRGTGYYGRSGVDPRPIPDAYPAILDQETADRLRAVQAALAASPLPKIRGANTWGEHTRRRQSGGIAASDSRLLAGLFACGVCGARMTGHRRTPDDRHTQTAGYVCKLRTERIAEHKATGLPSSVNSFAVEDAVLRVVRGALAMPPMPVARPAPRTRSHGRTVEAVDEERSKLTRAWTRGLVDDELFERHMGELNVERDAILQADSAALMPEQQRIAYDLADAEVLTKEELRTILVCMIERVEGPVFVAGLKVRGDSTGLRKCVRVRLKFPRADGYRTFVAPMYTAKFQGAREFWPCDCEPRSGVVECRCANFLRSVVLARRSWRRCAAS